MLKEIDTVTKSLQSRGKSLSDDLGELISTVRREKSERGSLLHGCRLGKAYISANARIVESPVFESAIVKIQNWGGSSVD